MGFPQGLAPHHYAPVSCLSIQCLHTYTPHERPHLDRKISCKKKEPNGLRPSAACFASRIGARPQNILCKPDQKHIRISTACSASREQGNKTRTPKQTKRHLQKCQSQHQSKQGAARSSWLRPLARYALAPTWGLSLVLT